MIVEDSSNVMDDIKRLVAKPLATNKNTLTIQQLFAKTEWPENETEKNKLEQVLEFLIYQTFGTKEVALTSANKIELIKTIYKEKNRLRYVSRNRAAVKYIKKLGVNTRPDVLIVKYGYNHFVDRYGKTIQSSLKNNNISYVLITPIDLHYP